MDPLSITTCTYATKTAGAQVCVVLVKQQLTEFIKDPASYFLPVTQP